MSVWDDEAGYDRDDPKHPDWADAMADRADAQRKREKEQQHEDEYRRELPISEALADVPGDGLEQAYPGLYEMTDEDVEDHGRGCDTVAGDPD